MRKLAILLILLSCAALAAPASLPWTTYDSTAGAFQVDAPGEPVTVSTVNETPMGNITESTCRWRVPGLEWLVSYSDVPSMVGTLNGAPLFVQVRRGFEKSSGNPVRNVELYNYQSCPGRSFEFKCKPSQGRPVRNGLARTFLAGNRLYVLTVTWDQATLPAERSEGDRFFNSFKLMKTP